MCFEIDEMGGAKHRRTCGAMCGRDCCEAKHVFVCGSVAATTVKENRLHKRTVIVWIAFDVVQLVHMCVNGLDWNDLVRLGGQSS